MRKMVLILATAILAGCAGEPDEIHVLSTGPLEDGLVTIIDRFSAETGHTVTLETGTTPVVRERLESGDAFDVVIATLEVIDAAAERGQVDSSRTPVAGRVGIGVAVREGVQVPVASSAAELRDLLLSADTVAYNEGSSGVYARSMIESLGITEAIADRTIRFANGTEVIAHVREGQDRDLGLAPLTEIQANAAAGVRMIPLPEEVQNYTAYHAVLGTGAVQSAAGFVEFMLTPQSREVFTATGVE